MEGAGAIYNLLYYLYHPLGEDRAAVVAALQGCGAHGKPGGCAACAEGRGCSAPPDAAFSGRIRVGLDGLNASLSGPLALLKAHAAFLPTLPQLRGAAAVDFKYSPVLSTRSAADASFPVATFSRYSVAPVAEIVTLKAPPVTPADPAHAGRHAAPAEFHALITSGAAPLVIDVRNAYESDIGCFTGLAPGVALLKPPVRRFEEMPKWVEDNAEQLGGVPRVAMYCAFGTDAGFSHLAPSPVLPPSPHRAGTGGIRCERFSALMRERFPALDVVQLSGGVQRYMEAAEAGALPGPSAWQGKLFNFDDRPAVAVVTGAPASPHIPGVLGRCVCCAAPFDEYKWLRCGACGVLVLVCDGCVGGGGGGDADGAARWRAALRCAECAAAGGSAASGAAAAVRAGRVRRSRKRGPRPDLAAAAAERRRAAAAAPGGAAEEGAEGGAVDALPGLFGDAD
jgi:predicted sulfurtransferase